MADNDVLQSAAPATLAAGNGIGFRRVTYSGDALQAIAPVGLGAFAGADDAKTFFDLGAASNSHLVAGASTNATNVKAAPGLLTGVRLFNNALYPVYLKLHNTAVAPVAGAGVVKTIGVQAGQARDVLIPGGQYFSAGIAFTIVKGIADADATAVAVSDCVVDVEYN